MKRFLVLAVLATVSATLVPHATDAAAQGVLDRLKRRAEDAAKREAEERAERRAEEAARKAAGEALDRVECAIPGSSCGAPAVQRLYEALSTHGRIVAAGVVFEPGSDRLRPEASGALSEVAGLFEAHPDLKLTIEAHVYTEGDADANLALSEKRAAAVKAYLARTHGLRPARALTQGLGDTQPAVAGNEASRRLDRIELVKD